jgi:cyclopropane-fatty-acyl-phospholipid synthase
MTVRYWDGEEATYGPEVTKAKLTFHEPMPIGTNMLDPMMAFCEAYMDGIFEIEGSWDDFMHVLWQNDEILFGKHSGKGISQSLKRVAAEAAMKKQQKENIQHHYDLGNDFFSLWLDETMSYSCGYFKKESDTLYQAQIQKIDHILKKLQLRPGERLLDIGSGWGWLIIRAAQEYGVRAVGITLSEAQCTAARERIRAGGLESLVEVQLLDYMDLDESVMQFDKIVSVGMFEHVGKPNMRKYMEKVRALLKPGGLSMLHTIAGIGEGAYNSWSDKYIFPGSYVPSLREVISLFPDYDFHLLHAESLRLHYAMTLDCWYRNFSSHLAEVEAKFGIRFIRMWRLYLLSNAANFRSTGLDLYQLLFSKGLNNDLPLTLESIYRDA